MATSPTSSKESFSFLSRLKFRVSQPVDIPRCYRLECSAYPSETAASKSTLQNIQHHACPFFRCVLLKKSKSNEAGKDKKRDLKLDRRPLASEEGEFEACHHVHHSPHNELIGFVCGTRCHDAAPPTEFKASAVVDAVQSPSTISENSQSYPYAMKHEANGRYLMIHSIVVQKEYRRLGVARALLEYYIKSVEIYNAELDEAGINRRRNKIKAKKRDTKIEKIILLSKSSMVNLFLPAGFQWRATVKLGENPQYEMERWVESSPSDYSLVSSTEFQPHPLMEQHCFLVDAFANLERGSGNPAAVVVLKGSPAKLLADYYNNVDTDHLHQSIVLHRSVSNSQDEEELAAKTQAEAWLGCIAKEFNWTTAFTWPVSFVNSENSLGKDSSSISDDDLNSSLQDDSSYGHETQCEMHHFIRFYTSTGVEINTCSHATLAAASVLFRWYGKGTTILSFHSRKDIVVQASLVSPPQLEESNHCLTFPTTPQSLPPVKSPRRLTTQPLAAGIEFSSISIAIDYPWRKVEHVPPGPQGQSAILAMLRRAFFRAWSVVSPDEKDDDTDGLAFSLSFDHVTYIGVTSDREDILVELSVEGYDMLSERSVDYDSLRQGWNGFTEGVIICCVPEPLDEKDHSDDVSHAETNGHGRRQQLPGNMSIDFCSRYFQPKLRDEDPASGWPHCALGPYFAGRLGKQRVIGLQSSDRGGLVECVLKESERKVCVVGAALTTLEGKTLMQV